MRFLRYCRTVLFVALRRAVSWAQFIITVLVIIVGCAIWLAAAFGMTLDPTVLMMLVRNPSFYVILVVLVVIVRLIFAQYWLWIEEHDSRVTAEARLVQLSGPVITPAQERLLSLIMKYQGLFVANKLIISRDGHLVFDGRPDRGKDVYIIMDLYGEDNPVQQQNFVALMDSIPTEYLRFFAEMRWNSPFVVSLTDLGMIYLRDKK